MGRRVERKEREKKLSHLKMKISAGIVLLLVIAYFISCALVPADVITKGLVMNGVEVGGMTEEEAEKALKENFEKLYKNKSLVVKAIDKDYTLPMYATLSFDAGQAATQAYDYAHSEFYLRGLQRIRATVFKKEMAHYPEITNRAALKKVFTDSGIPELNTTSQTTYGINGNELQILMGVTGYSVDMGGLEAAMKEAVAKDDYKTKIEAPLIQGKVEALDMDKVYEEIHAVKREATLDPKNKYKLVKSITGIDFDKDNAKAQVAKAKEGDLVHIEVVKDEPKISTQLLKKHLFEKTIGECTTYVSGTSDRISNVKLAASTINGTILMPKEEFAYNARVGERTAKRGYKKAPAYSNGISVQEYGGGVCQVSSTLYKAVVLANLKVTEHHNHTYESSYIDLGMDATVSWDGPDFKFKNDMDYPVKIIAKYSDGTLNIKIKGAKLNDNKVVFSYKVLKTIPRKVKYEKDKTMLEGKQKVIQTGHDGYHVQTYRTIVDKNGKEISSAKEDYNVYSQKEQIIAKGTKKKAPAKKSTTNTTTTGKTTTTGNTATTAAKKPTTAAKKR